LLGREKSGRWDSNSERIRGNNGQGTWAIIVGGWRKLHRTDDCASSPSSCPSNSHSICLKVQKYSAFHAPPKLLNPDTFFSKEY